MKMRYNVLILIIKLIHLSLCDYNDNIPVPSSSLSLPWSSASPSTSSSIKILKVGAIFFEDEIVDLDTYFKNAIEYVNDKILDITNIKIESIHRYTKIDGNSVILQQIACELLDDGVIAIFGPSSKASSDIIASICHQYGIPHILFDMSFNEKSLNEKKQNSMTVNIYPDLMILSKALADIIHSYSWKSYAVIYETNNGLLRLQDILQLLPINEDVNVFEAQDITDYFSILKNIKHLTEKRIIIDCEPENVIDFLKTASQFNMTDIIYSYFFTNLDTHLADLKQFENIKANTTAVLLKLRGHSDDDNIENNGQKTITRTIHDGVLLFAHAIKTLLKYYDLNVMETKVNCRRPLYWSFGEYILKQMKTIATKDETELITNSINFNEYGERIRFDLEVYSVRCDKIHCALFNWDPQRSVTKIIYADNSQNILSQSSLKGNLIYVSTRIGKPYLDEIIPEDGVVLQGNARYKGFSLDLIAALAKRIGFDFEIKIVPDGKNGNYDKNIKDWNGIIKELRDGRAHLGICDLTITHERKTAVEFTSPFMSLGVAVLYYKAPPTAPNLFSFLDPFALEVWLYMFTAYLLVALLLFIAGRISRDEWLNPHPCNQEPEELENMWNISNTMWLSMGSLMTQGCDILPRSGSLRFITGMWWFFALMVMNSYTANLAAFLTQSQLTTTIEDIKDLPEQNKIKYGTVLEQSTYTFFKESNDSVYSKIWNSMKNEKPSVFTKDNDEGVKRVRNSKGKYAFLMETTSLEYNLAKYCDLTQIGKKFSDRHYGIAMPMGVSYRSELNVEILKLAEEGVLKQLKDKWWNRTDPPCEQPHASSEGADLSIAEVGGVFLVLGAGILIAFILGTAEFLWNVQRVAAEEKMAPIEVFKHELSFAIKFWLYRKPVKKSSNIDDSSQNNLNKSRSKIPSSSSSSESKEQNDNNEDIQQIRHRQSSKTSDQPLKH